MRLQLGSAFAAWLALGGEVVASKEEAKSSGVRNIAIIGELALAEVDFFAY